MKKVALYVMAGLDPAIQVEGMRCSRLLKKM